MSDIEGDVRCMLDESCVSGRVDFEDGIISGLARACILLAKKVDSLEARLDLDLLAIDEKELTR